MRERWKRVKFGAFLRPNTRPYTLGSDEDANLVGMRLYGKGPFHRELKPALRIAKKSHFVIRSGDIIYNKLFAWKGTFGIVPPELDRMLVSDKFPTYELDRARADERYLSWYFQMPELWAQAQAMSTGSAALSKLTLNPPKFLLLDMPLPPLIEQRRTAARITELAAKIAEARTLRRAASAKHVALGRASVARIFKLAQAQFPSTPLGDCVELRGGGTPSKSDPSLWGGDIPWVTPKDMKAREIFTSRNTITSAGLSSSPAKLIAPGAVLIVVRGMILAHTFPSAVLRVPATINQDMKALVLCERLDADFLVEFFWAVNSAIVEMVEKSTHDTRKFTTQRLLGIGVPLPPINEQRRIAKEAAAIRSQLSTVAEAQAKADAQLDALLPSILDRAFKGEL
jgi:type I restriction enzyme S subunit